MDFGNGDDVEEVQHYFHGEKGDEEADSVEEGAAGGYAGEWVALLRDVVVESQDGAGDVQRSVEGICEVVEKGVIAGLSGDGNAVSFGDSSGVQLFLLGVVSRWSDTFGKGDRPRWGCPLIDPSSSDNPN